LLAEDFEYKKLKEVNLIVRAGEGVPLSYPWFKGPQCTKNPPIQQLTYDQEYWDSNVESPENCKFIAKIAQQCSITLINVPLHVLAKTCQTIKIDNNEILLIDFLKEQPRISLMSFEHKR
jgi:hypothetical protein|tara:strand:- start:252 stop:611 length:360 start_codon:yes stop_codon:yes gene_type:complete